MEIVYEHCCGLDIHKKRIVACLITPCAKKQRSKEIRTFRTVTSELLALQDWLREAGGTHIAMEATGEVGLRGLFEIHFSSGLNRIFQKSHP